MSTTRPLPKYRVLVETPAGWTPALWPDGEPAWRVCPITERAIEGAHEDAVALAEHYPDATLIVVDPDGVEVSRVEPLATVPF